MKNTLNSISIPNNTLARLPFKGTKPELKPVTVSDGFGMSLDIPSRGYASIPEYNAVMEIFTRYSSGDGIDFNRVKSFEVDVVKTMLGFRFNNINPNIEEEDIGAPMLKALFNFFSKELGLKIELPIGIFEPISDIETIK